MDRGPSKSSDVTPALVVGGLVAICCGGPLLVALLAATGAGAVLLSQGAVLLGAAILVATVIAALWVRGRDRRRVAEGADCRAPTTKEKS